MKRLAILSSLALLISPCFNAVNGSGLSHGRVFNAAAEGGDNASEIVDGYQKSVETITFGTEVNNSASHNPAVSNFPNFWKLSDGLLKNLSVTNDTGCYFVNATTAGTYALKLSNNGNAGKLVLSFKSNLIISEATVTAKVYSAKTTGSFGVSTDNDAGKNEDASAASNTDWSDFTFSGLDGDTKKSTEKFTLSGVEKKPVFISKIALTIWTKVVSETPVVTYDYGDVNYQNIEIKDGNLLESEEVESDGTITNPLKEGTLYEDWTGLYEFQGWYNDAGTTKVFDSTTKITESITLYAKWEVVEKEAFTNLKKAETKAQLNYKYSYAASTVEKTGILSFGGTTKNSNALVDPSSTSFYSFSGIDGIKISVDSVTNCYYNSKSSSGYALRLGKDVAGSITFKFTSAIKAKNIVVYSQRFNDTDSSSYTLTTDIADVSATSGVVSETEWTPRTFDNFSGYEINQFTLSVGAKSRVYIKQIDFVCESESESGETELKVSDIGMRFGALLGTKEYEAVKTIGGSIANYGVVCATSLPDGYDSVAAAAKAGKLDKNTSNSWNNAVADVPLSIKQTIDDAEYYVFNTYIVVKEASVSTIVYAAGFVTLDTGVTVYFKERSASVKSLAQEYINTKEYDGVIAETLGYLAEGKVSA